MKRVQEHRIITLPSQVIISDDASVTSSFLTGNSAPLQWLPAHMATFTPGSRAFE